MKIITTKDHLIRSLTLVEKSVGKKESLPVLSCVLLSVEKQAVLRSTNLEEGVETQLVCEIREPGVVAIPAQLFIQVVRSFQSGAITLTLDGTVLNIETTTTKAVLNTTSPEEFPHFSHGRGGEIVMARQVVVAALQSVIYATSTSMIRPELGSVLLRIENAELFAVATDSFRLAEKRVKINSDASSDVLLPLKHAHSLLHLLENLSGEEVTLSVQESQLTLTTETTTFFSRVTEGSFPQYQAVIPKIFPTEITVLKSECVDTLRAARVFAGMEQHIGFHVYPKKKSCTITARDTRIGEFSETISAACEGEDIDINFHIGYLSECFSHISSDSVTFGFAGIGKPLVIRGVGDASFTYLVMPLTR